MAEQKKLTPDDLKQGQPPKPNPYRRDTPVPYPQTKPKD